MFDCLLLTNLEAVGVISLITAVTEEELSLVIISTAELAQLSSQNIKCTEIAQLSL